MGLIRITPYRKFDTGAGVRVFTGIGQRHPPGEAVDLINIQTVLSDDGCNTGNRFCLNLTRQQRNNMAGFPLSLYPLLITFRSYRRKADGQPHFMSFEQNIFEYRCRFCTGGDSGQNAERQSVVDLGLANIENCYIVLRQNSADA